MPAFTGPIGACHARGYPFAALIGYKGLTSMSADGLSGDGSYHIFLWRL
jgi:hypothetical protein